MPAILLLMGLILVACGGGDDPKPCETKSATINATVCRVDYACDDIDTRWINCPTRAESPYECQCIVNELLQGVFTTPNFCGNVSTQFRAEVAFEECGFEAAS